MSSYLADLRAKVGHDLLLLPSVSVLPVDDSGRVLLRRHWGDSWGLVGGALDIDERPVDGAVRKAREAGVEVQITRLLDVIGGPEFRVSYDNGDETAYAGPVYEGRVIGEIGTEVSWFTLADLPTLRLASLTAAALRQLGY
jgi:ADP-ribose pyrophosphatase YjhB (NUDIX family)